MSGYEAIRLYVFLSAVLFSLYMCLMPEVNRDNMFCILTDSHRSLSIAHGETLAFFGISIVVIVIALLFPVIFLSKFFKGIK
jgi:hypothetical protein